MRTEKKLDAGLDNLFSNGGDKIYAGYVDDPRNTDNAWMETVAVNFHDEQAQSAAKVDLKAGSDAVGVRWTDLSSETQFYASHRQMLSRVAVLRHAHW